ncbi:hypothetical protein WICMUC_002856 [Wickerhamomyces mucosus]|uniref:Amino acid transporter transmembrane domain-containing protein n=1 Tax=Wickerhamomyces mucosus TaxID=1378264 RepID=A0A9P8PP94_9ASCO|nr:hypothetical protein WICMUC_002856 [Wickerhamomyces mucosus]
MHPHHAASILFQNGDIDGELEGFSACLNFDQQFVKPTSIKILEFANLSTFLPFFESDKRIIHLTNSKMVGVGSLFRKTLPLKESDIEEKKDYATSELEVLSAEPIELQAKETYNQNKLYPIESYLYYAVIERRRLAENETRDHWSDKLIIKLDIDNEPYNAMVPEDAVPKRDNSQMILRMGSFWSVFYLITSDILGPSASPYAFSTLGFGKGSILYTVLFGCAVYCGLLIWKQFLDLHSSVHPIRTFADLGFRLTGFYGKTLISFLHIVYLVLAVSQLILGSGQALSQIIKGKFCFVALMVFWMIFGWGLGQIRSLKHFSKVASFSVYSTITVCILSMAGVAHWAPNYAAAYSQTGAVEGPIVTKGFIGGGTMNDQLVGVMNIIYAYAGSILFPEMLAEMMNPFDFWKGSILAQLLIWFCYMVYGIFIYAYQGQFVINPGNQGVSNYALQTVCNVISLISGMLAAGLYGNVGLKGLYQSFLVDYFKVPELDTYKGKILWVFSTILYWAIAFIIAAAIPQLSSVAAIAAAACAIQFTYSFPALFQVILQMHKDAILADGEFDPETETRPKADTWREWSRWKRAYFTHWGWNTFNLTLGLSALALAGLGLWSSIEAIITTFQQDGSATSFDKVKFGKISPLDNLPLDVIIPINSFSSLKIPPPELPFQQLAETINKALILELGPNSLIEIDKTALIFPCEWNGVKSWGCFE